MELLAVRHAQPERSLSGEHPADPSLTAVGRQQAEALARWACEGPAPAPDRVVSSPMRRARETAEAVAARCGVEVDVDDRLAEFDLGAKEYIPLEMAGDELLAHAQTALVDGRWGTHRFDPEAFRARVAAGFGRVLSEGGAERVMVVCHGGVLNSWLSSVVERAHGVFFMPRYTSVSRVAVDDQGHPRLESLNELPHAHLAPRVTF